MPSDFYLKPTGIIAGAAAHSAVKAGIARSLAGGPLAFTAVELIRRGDGDKREKRLLEIGKPEVRKTGEGAAIEDALGLVAAPRRQFAGLSLDRPRIMGVVNVTPDSFSDGGRYHDSAVAIAHGRALIEAGA